MTAAVVCLPARFGGISTAVFISIFPVYNCEALGGVVVTAVIT